MFLSPIGEKVDQCMSVITVTDNNLKFTRVAIESNSLAHGRFSWPTQWTMTKLCRVVSRNVHTTLFVVEYATSIASAKLKQSQLLER